MASTCGLTKGDLARYLGKGLVKKTEENKIITGSSVVLFRVPERNRMPELLIARTFRENPGDQGRKTAETAEDRKRTGELPLC